MYSLNPSCYLPDAVARELPTSLACAPPPSYLSSLYAAATTPFTSTFAILWTASKALTSLSSLSFLLIPTMTSYSTSLNLLFFYLTWSTLVLSHPPLRVEIVATLAVRLLFYVLPSLFFLSFDSLLPTASESLKTLGAAGLPLKDANRKQVTATAKIVAWSIFNTLLGVTLQALTEILFTRVVAIRSALKVTTSLPMPWGIFKDLSRGFLCREILAYSLHRFLLHESHTPPAKYHQSWYHHDLPIPFPTTATYDHPLAYITRSFLPTYLPAVLFRFHLLTYVLYLALIGLEETFAYSGYSTVPTNFVLGGIARRTDNHLLCGGEGNFGPWGLVDWVVGTSVGGGDVLDDDGGAEADGNGIGKIDGGGAGGKKKNGVGKARSRMGRSKKDS